jgi:hypothetical protein
MKVRGTSDRSSTSLGLALMLALANKANNLLLVLFAGISLVARDAAAAENSRYYMLISIYIEPRLVESCVGINEKRKHNEIELFEVA